MQSDQKVHLIVDDLLSDPDSLEENEHDPELQELLLTTWNLSPEVYAILRRHGYNYEYLKQLDDRALNDVFSVAKWTGHKYALRNKLVQWPESIIVEDPCTSSTVVKQPEGKVKQHNMLATWVTRALLDDILFRNEKGKMVCQFYDAHNKLDYKHQKFLGHTLVDYYLANKLYFPLADMARFSELIVERFTSEICETYYNPRSARDQKKHPSGLLYDRFHNRNKPKKSNKHQEQPSKFPATDKAASLNKEALELPETGVEDSCTSSTVVKQPEGKVKQHNMLATWVTRALLDDILFRNEKGKMVCQFYDAHNKLDYKHQKFLGHTLVDYYLANKLYFPLADMARFSELIVERFTSEICETYYNPRSARDQKKHPSGLLYDRFHNRNKPKKSNKHQEQPSKFPATDKAASLNKEALELPETGDPEITRLNEIRQWLRNNVAPKNTLTTRWHDSILLRLRNLQDNAGTNAKLFDEWPRYLDDDGYLLIDDDFQQMFGSSEHLLTGWGSYCEKLKRYITDIKIGDQFSQELKIGILEGAYNEDYRDYAVAVLFHAVIKPSRTSSHNLPSILTAQLATCTIYATEAEFRTDCERLRDPDRPNKGQLSPRVFAIGVPPVLSTFYVAADKFIYKLPTILRCLDVVVKATHVLNYQFSESCETLFSFLSRFFYGIDYKRKSKISQLLKLLAFLDKSE